MLLNLVTGLQLNQHVRAKSNPKMLLKLKHNRKVRLSQEKDLTGNRWHLKTLTCLLSGKFKLMS